MLKKFLNLLFGNKKQKTQRPSSSTIPEKQKKNKQTPIKTGKRENWIIDPGHVQVKAFVVHMGLMELEGTFGKIKGEVFASPPTLRDLEVKATIYTDSFSSGSPARDIHVKSPDFLDTEKFPTIEFISTNIEWKPLNKFIIIGDLTLKGKTKPIVLEGQLKKFINKDVFGLRRAGFEAETTISRYDFGVIWEQEKNMTSEEVEKVLSDEVKIKVYAEVTEPQVLEIYKQMGINIE